MTALLEVRGLKAGYGSSQVLQGVDLDVHADQVAALFGRNGVGKSTLISAIVGMIRPRAGSVRFDGRELAGRPSHHIARAGIALVPQGRRIFAPLTVEENLKLAAARSAPEGEWTLERVYDLLPRLRDRRRNRGNQLSGGEQQMLAIARALLANPRLVLLDEPSEGLAPRVVDQVVDVLAELRTAGIPALLVEQNLNMAVGFADVIYIMDKGEIVYRSSVQEFRSSPDTVRALLSVS